jgi:ubiquinone biosynthesis protein Coq4
MIEKRSDTMPPTSTSHDVSSVAKLATLLHIYSSHQIIQVVGALREQQRSQMIKLVHDLLPDDDAAKSFVERPENRNSDVDRLAQLVNTAM